MLYLLQMWFKWFEIIREPAVGLFPTDSQVINIKKFFKKIFGIYDNVAKVFFPQKN